MSARIALGILAVAMAGGRADAQSGTVGGPGETKQVRLETEFVRLRGEVTVESPEDGLRAAQDDEDGLRVFSNARLRLWDGDTTYNLVLSPATESWDVEIPGSRRVGIEYTAEGETVIGNSAARESKAFTMSEGPSIVVLSGEEASYDFQEAAFQYFERRGDVWELKETAGANIRVAIRPVVGDDGSILFDRLALEATTMVGREKAPDTTLDVGKPIFETGTVETKFAAKPGTTYWLWPRIDDRRGALLIGVRATVVK